ncbi:unnamed protein product [Prunus armeniaca]|uniref:Uncharacterized protein n=1 Tax=Prunus armeniaca TaxID=36596 RepID=A0A6J5XDN0_PRUAR|nr:unnamed protein product [Prunus armeniaca]
MGLSRPHKVGNGVSARWVSLFCIASFFLGVLVVNSGVWKFSFFMLFAATDPFFLDAFAVVCK